MRGIAAPAALVMTQRHLGLGGQRRDCGGDRRADDADQQLHVVARDQLLRHALADLRIGGVVARMISILTPGGRSFSCSLT